MTTFFLKLSSSFRHLPSAMLQLLKQGFVFAPVSKRQEMDASLQGQWLTKNMEWQPKIWHHDQILVIKVRNDARPWLCSIHTLIHVCAFFFLGLLFGLEGSNYWLIVSSLWQISKQFQGKLCTRSVCIVLKPIKRCNTVPCPAENSLVIEQPSWLTLLTNNTK